MSSKLSNDTLKEVINAVLTHSKEKPKKFQETVELQVGLKQYDPQKVCAEHLVVSRPRAARSPFPSSPPHPTH